MNKSDAKTRRAIADAARYKSAAKHAMSECHRLELQRATVGTGGDALVRSRLDAAVNQYKFWLALEEGGVLEVPDAVEQQARRTIDLILRIDSFGKAEDVH